MFKTRSDNSLQKANKTLLCNYLCVIIIANGVIDFWVGKPFLLPLIFRCVHDKHENISFYIFELERNASFSFIPDLNWFIKQSGKLKVTVFFLLPVDDLIHDELRKITGTFWGFIIMRYSCWEHWVSSQ